MVPASKMNLSHTSNSSFALNTFQKFLHLWVGITVPDSQRCQDIFFALCSIVWEGMAGINGNYFCWHPISSQAWIGCNIRPKQGKGKERSTRKRIERNTRKGIERSTRKGIERSTRKGIERNTRKGIERSTRKGIERSTRKGIERSTRKGIERSTRKGIERSARKGIERSARKGKGMERSARKGI